MVTGDWWNIFSANQVATTWQPDHDYNLIAVTGVVEAAAITASQVQKKMGSYGLIGLHEKEDRGGDRNHYSDDFAVSG